MKPIKEFFAVSALVATTSLNVADQEVAQPKPMADALKDMSSVPLETTVSGSRISVDSKFDTNGTTPDKAVNIVFEDVNSDGQIGPEDHIVDAEIYNAGKLASLQRQADGTYQAKVYKEHFKEMSAKDKNLKSFNDAKITDSQQALQRAVAFVYTP